MKLLLRVAPEPEPWFPQELQNLDLWSEQVQLLLEQCVLIENGDFQAACREIQHKSPKNFTAFLRLYSRIPRVTSDSAKEDFVFQNPLSLLDARKSPRFLNAQIRRTRQAETKESRDSFFDRTLGEIAKFGLEIEFFDRYMFDNLLKSRSGTSWSIWNKFSRMPVTVRLHTSLEQARDENNFDYEARQKRAWGELKSAMRTRFLQESQRHPSFKLETLLYKDHKHDRYGRVVFPRGHINFEMTKGLEIFAKDPLEEHFKITPLSSFEYDERKRTWCEEIDTFSLPSATEL